MDRRHVGLPRSPERLSPAQDTGTWASISASQAVAAASLGIRQSPRGLIVPPALTFGPFGRALRLNWLAKKRRQNTSSQCRIVAEVVRRPALGRVARRPLPRVGVVPGVPGQERDLARPVAAAEHVVEREVLQRVGPDGVLGRLRLLALDGRDQLGGDLLVEHLARARRSPRSSNCPLSITHRMRCWIRVFGTPAFTL